MWDKAKARGWHACLALLLVCALAAQCAFAAAPAKDTASVKAAADSILIGSNRYEHLHEGQTAPNRLSLEGFEPVMENGVLAVYLRKEIAGIRILDKRSGYIWGSLPSDKPDNMNKTWSAIGNSVVSIQYFSDAGVEKNVGAGRGNVEFSVQGDRMAYQVDFSEVGISFAMEMRLEQEKLTVSLVEGSIREGQEFSLGKITFLPFLGSTVGNETSGYIFLPDGCGGLLRFSSASKYLTGFSKKVYGDDYAIDSLSSVNDLKSNRTNDFAVKEETVLLPVFGMVHGEGQNAFYAYVENSEEYALICADPSGVTTDYNTAGAQFVYRQKYEQPISRKGEGVQLVQKEPNPIAPRVTYSFLTGRDAGYVGMAKAYRSVLESRGVLKAADKNAGDIPLAVDFLMADVEKGLFGNSTKKITSLDDVTQAVRQLTSRLPASLQVGLKGWQKAGLNGYDKDKVQKSAVFGSFSKLGELRQLLSQGGGALYLGVDPFTAKEGQLNTRQTGAMTLSQTPAVVKRDDSSVFLGDTYYLKIQEALSVLLEQSEAAQNGNLLLGGMNALYGEYLSGSAVSRTQVKQLLTEQLNALSQSHTLALETPNAYLLSAAGSFRGTPMTNSQYLYESDTVPFLQIVLSGSIALFAPYANESFYSDLDVLKHIDYNTYPSFLMTQSDNNSLRNTASAELCSTRFEDWEQTIEAVYAQVNEVLRHTGGQMILDRRMLSEGVSQTVYESGRVIVNYSDADYRSGGDFVAQRSAVFLES